MVEWRWIGWVGGGGDEAAGRVGEGVGISPSLHETIFRESLKDLKNNVYLLLFKNIIDIQQNNAKLFNAKSLVSWLKL